MSKFRVGDVYKNDFGDEFVKIISFFDKSDEDYVSLLVVFGDQEGMVNFYQSDKFKELYPDYVCNDDEASYNKFKPGDKVRLKYNGFVPELGYSNNGRTKLLLPSLNKDVLRVESIDGEKWLKVKGCPLSLHKSRFELVDDENEGVGVVVEDKEKLAKKAMISQPMAGKTKEQIISERETAVRYLNNNGYEVIDTVFDFSDASLNVFGVRVKPVYYLSQAIREMSMCDLVYFCKGWKEARGCKIEHDIAKQYGLEIAYEDSTRSSRILDLILYGFNFAEKGGRKVKAIHIGKNALSDLQKETENDLICLATNYPDTEINKLFDKDVIVINDPEQTNNIFVVLEGKGNDAFYLQKDMNAREKE